jgi:maleate isomerase
MVSTALPPLTTTGIGLVVPYDFALDRELWRWTPDDVTLHLTRLPFAALDVTVEMVTMLGDADDIAAATRQVITVAPKVVVYACTSGSFIRGLDGESVIREVVTSAGAPAAVTTSGALVEALDELGVQKVAVATPYTRDITEALRHFLEATGRSVVGTRDLSMETAI